MTHFAVVGLGFGDESKGAATDHLCRVRDVGLVVRHNGGAQAGHNVVTEDGRHHTFAQWGSGTLAGVPTFLSKYMVVDPLALVPEAEHLMSIGVEDPWSMLTIDPEALVVTPWHRAAQRFDENLRGDQRHGTCGMGIGNAVEESIKYPNRELRWGDLVHVVDQSPYQAPWVSYLAKFMRLRFQDHSLASMEQPDGDWSRRPDEVAAEFLSIAALPNTKPWMEVGTSGERNHSAVVFEGAQGVLLDQDRGFHPHTTWSTCTFDNADALSDEVGMDRPYRLGVTRSYSVRHGPGPFPTEDKGWKPGPEPYNSHDAWRGGVRYGPLDLVLLRYATEACGGVDGIAVTHLDVSPGRPVGTLAGPTGRVNHIPVPVSIDLGRQEALGKWLEYAAPAVFDADVGKVTGSSVVSPETICRGVQFTLDAPVVVESYGPTAADRKDVGLPS